MTQTENSPCILANPFAHRTRDEYNQVAYLLRLVPNKKSGQPRFRAEQCRNRQRMEPRLQQRKTAGADRQEVIVNMFRIACLCVVIVLSLATSLAMAQDPAAPSFQYKPLRVRIKELRASDQGTRKAAAHGLIMAGPGDKEAVPDLIDALSDSDASICAFAAGALGCIGPDAALALPKLKEKMNDNTDDYLRANVASALLRIDSQTTKLAVPVLIETLRCDQSEVRVFSSAALGELGPRGKAAVPALVELLKDEDDNVRSYAARALGQIGGDASVTALRTALRDKRAFVRFMVADSLGTLGVKARQAVPDLIEATKDEEPRVRGWAVSALGRIGGPAEEVIPVFRKALHDEDNVNRLTALYCLRLMGPKAKETVPDLVAMLKDGDGTICSVAALALAAFGPEARAAIPDLEKALKSEDANLRCCAACALAKVDRQKAADIVPLLTQFLQLENQAARLSAIEALGTLGPTAKAGVPELQKALGDKSEIVNINILYSLGNISADSSTITTLIAALRDKQRNIRYAGAKALGEIGPEAAKAVPDLIDVFKAEDADLKISAADALGEIGPAAREAIPLLHAALKHNQPGVRMAAARGLGGIGAEARAAVPDLLEACNGEDENLRVTAVRGLGKVGPEAAPQATPILTKLLASEDTLTRCFAAEALGRMDPAQAEGVVPVLARCLQDRDSRVRTKAAWALGVVGAAARDEVPALRRGLEDDELTCRFAAAFALWKIEHAVQVAPTLMAAFKEGLPPEIGNGERLEAVKSLGEMAAADNKVVPFLRELAGSENRRVANAAAEMLKKLGSN
jgi:HEAT repeat protein